MREVIATIAIVFFGVSLDAKFDFVGSVFFIVSTVTIFQLIATTKNQVTLISVYYIFSFIFMSLMPWLHYSHGATIWRTKAIPDDVNIINNSVVFLSNLLVFVLYSIFYNYYTQKKTTLKTSIEERARLNKGRYLYILSFSALVGVFYLNEFKIENILFRGIIDESRNSKIEQSSLALIAEMFSRLTPVFCFYYAITSGKKNNYGKSLLFFSMLFSVFPTGVPRYLAAFTYIPIFLYYFPVIRNGVVFSISIIFSVIYLFPFLDQFRYFSGVENIEFVPKVNFFFAAHFDAYENLATAIENNFITSGRQLLGVLLFFVPRVLWVDKPVGSGYELANRVGYDFNNISMPFLGEGFVNFGYLGVVFFILILTLLLAKYDALFQSRNKMKFLAYDNLFYFFSLGGVFFILRGDLLSSFSYYVAGISVYKAVKKFA